ncbi:MAG: divalent-cation tolerance protein CutA [Candidatus Omnitrophica bacterium]|nr:divalent-cation tolerance protein CutA [Candidatus Omnitrophota bacterium]
MAKRFIIIMITCASRSEASRIVDALLRSRLVACANIVGSVRSRFWWMGRLDAANESLVICKTIADNFRAVSKKVKELHSYKVPEILSIPITDGSKPYLGWIEESVGYKARPKCVK